ncbi:hypothetical protein AK812_SmicGene9425 [Symbiodinium microadriaticum]|uniref:Uncharacterized protein n=1 Tax=Symbiodinium microadriaticum TaxID=2951 RepID=A0A1Q9EIL8_SYMMI|nr:hypothetical protein AK812_SmicGene9425 [Symbiodinium microadriaticum]
MRGSGDAAGRATIGGLLRCGDAVAGQVEDEEVDEAHRRSVPTTFRGLQRGPNPDSTSCLQLRGPRIVGWSWVPGGPTVVAAPVFLIVVVVLVVLASWWPGVVVMAVVTLDLGIVVFLGLVVVLVFWSS